MLSSLRYGLLTLVVAVVVSASCTGDVGNTPGGGGEGGEVDPGCTLSGSCDDDEPCTIDHCDNNTRRCVHEALPDQVIANDTTPGDCAVRVCIDGVGSSSPDDSDLPDDNNPCTAGACNDGVPANFPVAAGTPCGDDVVCDDSGHCLGCNDASDCPAPGGCDVATCIAGMCGVTTAPDGAPCTSDGTFCNGQEECQSGSCISPGNPCPGPDDDGDCSESCSESNDNCNADDPSGSDCDDGLYCNGTDNCNPQGNCSQHSGNPCPGADGDADCSESCNEGNNSCGANDPDGSDCNGTPGDAICCMGGSCVTSAGCI